MALYFQAFGRPLVKDGCEESKRIGEGRFIYYKTPTPRHPKSFRHTQKDS
jgi:hypothetical protein